MPLVHSPTLTPKKLAANRANAQLSRGPITLDGLIRVRDSNIKHGAYAQDREETLRVLGEDPKDFEALLESLRASGQPAKELEGLLVKRLVRAIWRTEQRHLFSRLGIAKSKLESEVLLRREDSSFRQVGRLIDLLTKLKRDAWRAENKKNNIENEGESHDVVDNKGRNFLSHDVIHNKAS